MLWPFHFYSCVYAIGSRPQWRNIGLKSAAKSVKTSKMNLEERIIILTCARLGRLKSTGRLHLEVKSHR